MQPSSHSESTHTLSHFQFVVQNWASILSAGAEWGKGTGTFFFQLRLPGV
jgi:hypothetical protein